jgi:hypothetical protein
MKETIRIKIKENHYVVKFPTAGQFIDIEKLKSTLSDGLYGQMFRSGTRDSEFALDIIDTEAYIMVLIPDLKKDLNVTSLRELSLSDAKEVTDVFKNQLLPFINKWRDVINKVFENKEEVEEKE